MALPPKSVQVDRRNLHLEKTTPPLLEQFLNDAGYTLRVMWNKDEFAVQMSREEVHTLHVQDVVEAAGEELAEKLIADAARKLWRVNAEGHFQCGDQRLYVQSFEARDAFRAIRREDRLALESEEHVFEQVEEMNQHLNEEAASKGVGSFGRVEPGLRGGEQPPPISSHASGGAREVERSRLAERLAGNGGE